MESQKKPANEIRVGSKSRVSGIINYCQRLIKENKFRELIFNAVGGSIGILVTTVEVLKTMYPGIHQMNRFATISYQSVEEGKNNEIQNLRLYPKLEVKLTLDKPAQLGVGYQEPLSEEERKKLLELQEKRRQGRQVRRGPPRGGFRGRRGFRNISRRGSRGRRGRFGMRGRPPMRGSQPMRRRQPMRGSRGGRGSGRGAPK